MKKILAITLLSCCLLRGSEEKSIVESILQYDLSAVERQYEFYNASHLAREFKRFFAIYATSQDKPLRLFNGRVDHFWSFFSNLNEYNQFCQDTFGQKIERIEEASILQSKINEQKKMFKQQYTNLFGEKPSAEWDLKIISGFGPIPSEGFFMEFFEKNWKKQTEGYSHPQPDPYSLN